MRLLLAAVAALLVGAADGRWIGGYEYPDVYVPVMGGSAGPDGSAEGDAAEDGHDGGQSMPSHDLAVVDADPGTGPGSSGMEAGGRWPTAENSWYTRSQLLWACGMDQCQSTANAHCFGSPESWDGSATPPQKWDAKPDGHHHQFCCRFDALPPETAREVGRNTSVRDPSTDAVHVEQQVEECFTKRYSEADSSAAAQLMKQLDIARTDRAMGWCIGGDRGSDKTQLGLSGDKGIDDTLPGVTGRDRCQQHGGKVIWSYHNGRIFRGDSIDQGCVSLDYARRLFDRNPATKQDEETAPTPTPTFSELVGLKAEQDRASALNKMIGALLDALSKLDINSMDPETAAAYLAALRKLNLAQEEFVDTVSKLFPDLFNAVTAPSVDAPTPPGRSTTTTTAAAGTNLGQIATATAATASGSGREPTTQSVQTVADQFNQP